jgi:hypothetical protein
MALSKQATKNKVAKPGASFDSKLVAAKPPHQPRISPQTDHQITTPKPSFFQNTPQKCPQNDKISPQIPSRKKHAKT